MASEERAELVEQAREAAMGWNTVLSEFAERCEALALDSDSMRIKALEGIKFAKGQKKSIDQKRKSLTGPANTIVKNANAEFRPQMDTCDAVVALLTEKVRMYDREREADQKLRQAELEATIRKEHRARLEALEKTAELAEEEGDKTTAAQLRDQAEKLTPTKLVTMPASKATIAGVSERQVWTCEIVDLEKVPMEYCDKVPRLKDLLDACRKKEGDVDIPGVRFEKTTGFASR